MVAGLLSALVVALVVMSVARGPQTSTTGLALLVIPPALAAIWLIAVLAWAFKNLVRTRRQLRDAARDHFANLS
jgi:hypothetical protein